MLQEGIELAMILGIDHVAHLQPGVYQGRGQDGEERWPEQSLTA